MLIHNKDKSLMCKYCSQHFTSKDTLQRHYSNIHSSDYICTICGKRTKSRKALHNHQNVKKYFNIFLFKIFYRNNIFIIRFNELIIVL